MALSGPLYATLRRYIPDPPQLTPKARKVTSVQIRLHGTPAETAATLTALAKVLDVHSVSRPYPDRPPSTLHRIYLTVTVRSDDSRGGAHHG